MSNDQSAEQRKPDEGEAASPREAETAAGGPQERRDESAGDGSSEQQGPAAPSPEELKIDPEAAAASGDEAVGEAEPETAVASEEHQSPEGEIARLTEELEAARGQADENWQRYVRAEAEKENIRKRAEKDADNARKQGMEKLANELLGVRDSLELGADAAAQEDADLEKIREGTDLTLKMLVQAMEKCNIEEINPVGERFDPELHQAMSMQEVEDQETNTVVSVMQKGYRLGDRLLRPALVMVAK